MGSIIQILTALTPVLVAFFGYLNHRKVSAVQTTQKDIQATISGKNGASQ